jgi:hypothetical protein
MLSSTNFWMCLAGLIYLVVGVFVIRKEISAARGWERLITLGCVFFAAPLAMFAPEHFRGPEFVKNSVPSWTPVRWFWPYFVGCALLAAATSLALRKCVRGFGPFLPSAPSTAHKNSSRHSACIIQAPLEVLWMSAAS